MRAYIAGPMRGFAGCNFPAFRRAKAHLERHGITVISPVDLDETMYGVGYVDHLPTCSNEELSFVAFDLADTIRRDVEAILSVDAIVLLPGYEGSTGAKTELAVARWAGKKVGFMECIVTGEVTWDA